MMKKSISKVLFGSFGCFLLSGCWEQHDVVNISSDGVIEIESTISIPSPGDLKAADIDKISDMFISDLAGQGWELEREWESKDIPYELEVTGKGNLDQIAASSAFYELKKIDDETYEIIFLPAESKGKQSSRSIEFDLGFFSGVEVLDKDGNEVDKIDNALKTEVYTIKL
jgi:hypothetical protein